MPSPRRWNRRVSAASACSTACATGAFPGSATGADRKSTRLNSSHLVISYAVFCLKKKKQTHTSLSSTTTPHIQITHSITHSRSSNHRLYDRHLSRSAYSQSIITTSHLPSS